MTGFLLSEIIDRYIYAYSPNLEVRRKTPLGDVVYVKVPVYDDFIKLMNLVNSDTDAMKKYRKDLLGSAVQMYYPEVQSQISACQKRNIPWNVWLEIPIYSKARMIAFDSIGNMVEIIQKHYQMTEERQAKFKSNKTAKGK